MKIFQTLLSIGFFLITFCFSTNLVAQNAPVQAPVARTIIEVTGFADEAAQEKFAADLNEIKGVKFGNLDVSTGKAIISYLADDTNPLKIAKSIKEMGLESKVLYPVQEDVKEEKKE